MFIKDKVLPGSIDDFVINKNNIKKIDALFNKDFIQNLYLYGPKGCGKYSLFIKQLEKVTESKIKLEYKSLLINNEWSNIKEKNIACSPFHFEIHLGKYNNNRCNLFALIDTVCESREINQVLPYKIIVIRNIHYGSIEFLKFIKQKSEIDNDYTKFICIGDNKSLTHTLLKGVFFNLRLTRISLKDILKVIKLNKIKTKLKTAELKTLILDNNNNLSLIFTKLDILQHSNFYQSRTEIIFDKIYKLLHEKKINVLYEFRELMYEIQINNESIEYIINKLLKKLLSKPNSAFSIGKKKKLTSIMCEYDINKAFAYKESVHIERLLFQIFNLYYE